MVLFLKLISWSFSFLWRWFYIIILLMTFSGTWSGLIWMFSRLQSEKPEKINWLSESERPDWSPELSSHHVFLCEWMEVINKKTCFHIKYNFYCQHKQISHDENIKRKSLNSRLEKLYCSHSDRKFPSVRTTWRNIHTGPVLIQVSWGKCWDCNKWIKESEIFMFEILDQEFFPSKMIKKGFLRAQNQFKVPV